MSPRDGNKTPVQTYTNISVIREATGAKRLCPKKKQKPAKDMEEAHI